MNNLFQLLGEGNEQIGLVTSDLNEDVMEKRWSTFYEASDDISADTFVGYMKEQYPKKQFKQVFVTELYPLY